MKQHSFLLAILTFCITTIATAQDSLITVMEKPNGTTSTIAPLITIKADELSRFPTTNFLDALEGVFPWVYGSGQQVGNFLFVVNGTLMADVNSISLQDIDEISFTRDNICAGLLPFSKAGTFFIKTKKAKGTLRVNFNSQFNLVNNRQKPFFGKDSYIYSPFSIIQSNSSGNDNGNFIGNHLSLSQSGKKYDWYAAAFFNHNQAPGIQQNVKWNQSFDTTLSNEYAAVKERLQQISLFATFNYQFSSKFKVGVMANYAKKKLVADSSLLSTFGSTVFSEVINAKPGFNTFTVSAYLEWKPFAALSNRLSAEYVNYKYDETADGRREFLSAASTGGRKFTSSDMQKNTALLLRHQLQYELVKTKRIDAGVDINTFFHKPDFESSSNYVEVPIENPDFPFFARSTNRYSRKFTSVNPAFYFSYNKMLRVYAGAGYFFGTIKTGDTKFSDRFNPYAGIDFDLKNLFSTGKGIDALHLSVNYAQVIKSTWSLPQFNYGQMTEQPVFSSNIIISPNIADLIKDKFIAVKLTAGMFKNRLMLAAEYSRLLYDKIFISHIGGSQPVDIFFRGSEIAQGTSFLMSAMIIDKKDWQLSSRFSILLPKVQSQVIQTSAFGYTNETASRAGLQSRLAYKNYFLQVGALLYLDQYFSAAGSSDQVKKTDFVVNNTLLGYRIPTVKGLFKNCLLYVQSRNMVVSKYLKEKYLYNRFAGVGIELSL